MGQLDQVLHFIVPTAHWEAAINWCHWDAGHQGQQWILHLLQDQFWWPSMMTRMQKAISSCEQCIQHEGIHAKVPKQPIIATAPLELLHMDFTSIEVTIELGQPPDLVNVLAFSDHFTRHVMAYMTPDQTAIMLQSFCGKVISWSSEHWLNSCVNEAPTLKAASPKSCMSSWAYRRFKPHLIMLRPTGKLSKLTRHW